MLRVCFSNKMIKDLTIRDFILKLFFKDKPISWSSFVLNCNLNAIDVDKEVFLFLIEYLNINEFIYSFLKSSLNEDDDCCKFLKDPEILNKFINLEGQIIYSIDDFEVFEFSVVNFLKDVELKHPEIFLRFFLKIDISKSSLNCNKNGFLKLLYLIIKRTKIRSTKIKKFEKLIPLLRDKYNHYNNIETFLN